MWTNTDACWVAARVWWCCLEKKGVGSGIIRGVRLASAYGLDAPAILPESEYVATVHLRQIPIGTVPGISLCQYGRGSGERA